MITSPGPDPTKPMIGGSLRSSNHSAEGLGYCLLTVYLLTLPPPSRRSEYSTLQSVLQALGRTPISTGYGTRPHTLKFHIYTILHSLYYILLISLTLVLLGRTCICLHVYIPCVLPCFLASSPPCILASVTPISLADLVCSTMATHMVPTLGRSGSVRGVY